MVDGVRSLVVDDRLRRLAGDNQYPFQNAARGVAEALGKEINSLQSRFEARFWTGRFGEQHGDPRPDNVIAVFENDEKISAVVLDPVRLAVEGKERQEPRMMREWYLTDTVLQAGMALGRVYARLPRRILDVGVRAYEAAFADSVLNSEKAIRHFGVALAYGLTIEVAVLNYEWFRRRGAVEPTGEIEEKLAPYWRALGQLSGDFGGWVNA